MKKLFYLLLLLPMLVIAQNNQGYAVIENGMITAHPAKIKQFETGVAAHNKKYHAEGAYGARVYWISNGTNIGKYMWVMGPLPWSAFDNRPAKEGHDDDWNTNVLPYVIPEGDQTYWKFNANLSNFSKDFTINKLLVDVYDLKRFQNEKMNELMVKIQKVMVTKFPDDAFGIYTNEFSSMDDGKDMAFVSFFNKMGWLGEDGKFPQKYDEVHGEGSFGNFLKEWGEISHGKRASELWIFREDLSGLSGEVKAATRQ